MFRAITGDDGISTRPYGHYVNANGDFIPLVKRTPVNFIINEFELSEEDKNCCICMSDKNNEQMCRLNCCHSFCVECMDIHLNTKHNCPLCRTDITQIQSQTIESRQKFHH